MAASTHPLRLSGWLVFCCALLATLQARAVAQEFTDLCEDAPVVSDGQYDFDLTNATGGEFPFSPDCAFDRLATIDQWVRYVASKTGAISVSTVGLTKGDTVLSLHDLDFRPEFQCEFARHYLLACNDDFGGPQSRVVLSVQAGQEILVRVAGALESRPVGSVLIEPFTPPAGDLCDTALPAVDGVNSYDVTGAVLNSFTACFGLRDVWFVYVPEVRGALTVSSCGQPTVPGISVFDACGGNVLGCSGYEQCSVGLGVEAGIPVLIRIANDQAVGPEQFTVTLDPDGIPPNDTCTAPAVALLGATAFDNTFATTEAILACGGGLFPFTSGLDVWFEFTPDVSGTYDISTEQSLGISDTRLALFTDCFDAPFACDDDSRGFLSFIRTPLNGGQRYVIAVTGNGLPQAGAPIDRGSGVLSIRLSVPPANDECSAAITVTQGVSPYDVYDATTTGQLPSCLPFPLTSGGDVWFRFVPDADGPVEASLLPGGAAFSLSVFEDCEDAFSSDTAGQYFSMDTLASVPRVIVDGQAGTPILLRVAFLSFPGEPLSVRGDGELYVGAPTTPLPPNDRCDDAAPITPGVTTIDLTGSIKDCSPDDSPEFDPSAAVTDNDVFFRFTAPQTRRYPIDINDGVRYPEFAGLVVSVYDSCGAAPIAGSFAFGDAPQDFIEFDGVAGQQYIIRVGSVLAFGSSPVLTGYIRVGLLCPADFVGDGIVNSVDVGEFINAWFEDQVFGTLVTDWDRNGIVNSTDVGEFINDWFADIAAGCG